MSFSTSASDCGPLRFRARWEVSSCASAEWSWLHSGCFRQLPERSSRKSLMSWPFSTHSGWDSPQRRSRTTETQQSLAGTSPQLNEPWQFPVVLPVLAGHVVAELLGLHAHAIENLGVEVRYGCPRFKRQVPAGLECSAGLANEQHGVVVCAVSTIGHVRRVEQQRVIKKRTAALINGAHLLHHAGEELRVPNVYLSQCFTRNWVGIFDPPGVAL